MIIKLDEAASDHPIITIGVSFDGVELHIMGSYSAVDRRARLTGVHIHGATANSLGPDRLRRIALALLKEFDLDEVEVVGAARSNGATPGRIPKPIWFPARR